MKHCTIPSNKIISKNGWIQMYAKAIAVSYIRDNQVENTFFKNPFNNSNRIIKYLNICLKGNIWDLMKKMMDS